MPNAPAKRAAVLMISIGVLILGVSFVSTMYALLQPEWIDVQLKPYHEALGDNPLLQRPALTWMIAISGGMGLIESGLSIGLGLWILRGRHWAIVTSLVLTILRLIIVGLFALVAVLAAAFEKALRVDARSAGNVPPPASPPMAMNIALGVGATVVLLLLAVWLIQAIRVERRRTSGPFAPVLG
jgi:hypothetical protein